MPLFDVSETADFLRDGGETDRQMMIFRRQLGDHLIEHRLIIVDQSPLGAALDRIAEWIERGAADESHLRQQLESRKQPRPKAHLARQPGRSIPAGKQRRRKMKLEPKMLAVEFSLDLFFERTIGIQARHLVFILVD